MRKLACVFIFSIMLALASAGDVQEFNKAMQDWLKNGHNDALALFNLQTVTIQYFQDIAADASCAADVNNQINAATQQGADQWDADKSQIGSITTNLLNFVFPSIIVKYKKCADQDTLRRDETNLDNANDQVMKENPEIAKTYNIWADEIGFLTKGQLPQNDTCVALLADFIEYYRIGGIAQFANKVDAFSIIAKLTYVYSPIFTKRAQQCLTGPADSLFNTAFIWYFNTYPAQKDQYDLLDDMVSTLSKTLPHDDDCAKKINDKITSQLQDAYTSFVSGTATISELAAKFLYTYLPEGVNDAKGCLTP